MAKFQPVRETCPICDSTGNCRINDYYGRSMIDFRNGHPERDELCIMRVFCDSCKHAHAILPDCIIPYSSYSLFFVLRLLGEYFAGLCPAERLCEKFGITLNQLYKWLKLWKTHKREWLGLLADAETSDTVFLRRIISADSYSAFAMEFIRHLRISFLQSHANPVVTGSQNAHYHQTVFAPDISIDEAQYLNTGILNDIKMLMNYGYDSVNYFTLILCGESHLNDTLRKPVHEALRQRITVHYNYSGLSDDEVAKYILHKLELAGTSSAIMDQAALAAAHSFTQGNPRLIDNLMTDALTIGSQQGHKVIDAEVIRAAVDNQGLY